MQFRELLTERECREAFALLHHIRRTDRGPDSHKQMDMIGLHSQFQNRPALLVALLANQVITAFANLIYQHLSSAFGTPDEVVDNQMHMMFVALIVQVAHVVYPVAILPLYLQDG